VSGQDSTEKRHFHRVAHDARATLSLFGAAWTCTVQDLSLKGCLVRLAQARPLDPRQTYHLTVHLTDLIKIDMDVALSHQEGLNAGLRCVDIDLDSATGLRRLVELNLGDSALLERDLHALVRP